MTYLTLEEIHKQLRLEPDFTEDNDLLEGLGDASESFLADYLDTALDDITAENSGTLPYSLHQALLILVSYFYDNDGSGEQRDLPRAFFILTSLYKKYLVQ